MKENKEVKEMTNVRKNKMIVTKNQKEEKEMIDMEERKEIENKEGVKNMSEKIDKKEVKEVIKEIENKEGVKNMSEKIDKKEVKEVIKEIEAGKLLLVEKVFKWVQGLNNVKDVHVKIKGNIYPLIEKGGKLYVIDKVNNKKLSFNNLDQSMKFVIVSVLAERKEQIEKEVEEGQRKYLKQKLDDINELLNKF